MLDPRAEVVKVLRLISLQPKLKSIRTIACFAIVAKSLQMHVTEGMQRRWVFPTLLDDPPSRPGPSAAAASCAPNPPNPSEVESALGEKVGRLRGNDKGDGNGRNEGSDENCAIGTAGKRRLSVEGLVPFWLDFGAVPNTFGVESMVLLTGPNTSGEQRSLALFFSLLKRVHERSYTEEIEKLDLTRSSCCSGKCCASLPGECCSTLIVGFDWKTPTTL